MLRQPAARSDYPESLPLFERNLAESLYQFRTFEAAAGRTRAMIRMVSTPCGETPCPLTIQVASDGAVEDWTIPQGNLF